MTRCPGCGLALDETGAAATHPYIGASAECWALWGDVQVRERRQLAVDTYAVQHPGVPERRSIQSVALHLMTLYLFLERGTEERHGPMLHRRMVASLPPDLRWLEPPSPNGTVTVADVLAGTAIEAWARDVWAAWSAHHDTVRGWTEQLLR